MKTKTINLYSFAELSDKAKENAIIKLSDINVDHEWWVCTYEDAEQVGIELTGFDQDSYCNGKFMESAEETAHKIIDNHGDSCETYKTAAEYLKIRDAIIETAERDENGEFVSEYDVDQKLDGADDEFLKSILEDYRIILRKEYEYLTSEVAIIETIEANEYNFLDNGELE